MRPTRLVLAASTLLALALPQAAGAAAPLCSPASCATAADSTRTVVLKPKTKAKKTTSLRVSVKFAPKGSKPKVTVTGPGGFKRKLSTTKTFRSVKPGRYVIAAEPIKGASLTTFATYRKTVAKVRKHAVAWIGVRYRQQVDSGTLVAQPSAITAVSGDPNGTRTVTVQDPQGLIKVGSVITAGVGPQTPGGMLVEVKSVTRQGDVAITQADPAPLTAIGPQAEIISQPQLKMTAEDFNRVASADPQSDPGAFKQGSALKKLPGTTRNLFGKKGGDGADKPFRCSSRAGAKLTGDVSFDAGTSVGVAWGGWLHPGTITAHVGVELKQSAKLKVEVYGEAKCELELELLPEDYRFTPWTFTVGPVPVVIVPKLNFLINGEAEIAASTAIEVDQSLSTSFGLAYDGDNFGPYGRADAEFKTKYYEPSGSMNLKAAVGPRLAFDFYDVAGPYLTAGIFMQLKADTDKSPWWRLSSGLQAGGGLRFKVWKFGFDYNKPDIWSKDWTVAQAKTQAPIALDGAAFPAGDNGKPYSAQVKTTRGKGTGYYVTSGALPAGLALNRTTGAITGTPTAHGASSFQISVVNGEGQVARKDYSITVRTQALALSTASLDDATSGVAYRVVLAATGSLEPYTWKLTGALPEGLKFDAGQLSGTPTQTGTFKLTVTATGADGKTATKTLTLKVLAPPLVIETATLADGMDGVLYDQTLAAVGGEGTYTWSVTTGTLPAGLTLDPATGKLSGRPTAQGDSAFTVKVADTTGHSTSKAVTLKIHPPGMVITAPTFPATLQGDAFSATLTALGGTGPYSWAVTSGALPAGLTLDPATGAITGNANTGGDTTFTVTVTDASNAQTTKELTITIIGEPAGTPQEIAAIDCWSATACLAVGFRSTWLYDGTTWTKSSDTQYYNPGDLSCFNATRCVMMSGGDAFTWNGTAWTSVGRPAPAHGNVDSAVHLVSCYTATRCEVGGDEEDNNEDDHGYSWRLDGNAWGRSVAMPEDSYYGFDCLSDTFCTAVQAWDGLTTFNGTAWSGLQNTGLYNTRVSCNSTTSCLIVGGHDDKTVKWTGSLGAATSSGTGSLSYAADCQVGGTICAAGWFNGQLGVLSGGTWTKSAAVAGFTPRDVACPTATKCIAVGTNARWYVWDGTSWARQRGFAYN